MRDYLETMFDFKMLKKWEDDEASRIRLLIDEALISELAAMMSGQSYSWSRVKKGLRDVKDVARG